MYGLKSKDLIVARVILSNIVDPSLYFTISRSLSLSKWFLVVDAIGSFRQINSPSPIMQTFWTVLFAGQLQVHEFVLVETTQTMLRLHSII